MINVLNSMIKYGIIQYIQNIGNTYFDTPRCGGGAIDWNVLHVSRIRRLPLCCIDFDYVNDMLRFHFGSVKHHLTNCDSCYIDSDYNIVNTLKQ